MINHYVSCMTLVAVNCVIELCDFNKTGTQSCCSAARHLPVRHYTRVVTLLVLIHFHITHQNKGSVSAIGSDYTRACDGLREMGVYGRATDRLQTLKLPRRGNIKSLQALRGRETNTRLQPDRALHRLRNFKTVNVAHV